MSFIELLKKYNDGVLRGASVKLAKRIGKSEATISRITRGELAIPEALAPKIAKEFGVTVAKLMECFPKKSYPGSIFNAPGPCITDTFYVPVLGIVSAEMFKNPLETIPTGSIPIPSHFNDGRQLYALKIVGDCMEPKAHNGDHAIVVSSKSVADGTLAVICLKGECTLKRVFHHTDYLELKPDNPKFKTMKIPTTDCEVVGQVLGFFNPA